MQLTDIPVGTTDWALVERTEHQGETGVACWQTRHFGTVQMRLTRVSPGL